MTNIVLVQCTNKPMPYNDTALPIQLLSAAGVLQESGFKVGVLHQGKNNNLADQIKGDPLLMCINATTGESLKQGIKLAALAHVKRDIKVVWIGSHVSVLPEQTLESSFADYVIVGDADLALNQLALDLEAGKAPESKILNMQCDDLDKLPFVPFDLVDLKEYNDGAGMPILTSRGCPHACGFCTNPAIHKSRWRAMSADRIVEHVNYYKEKYHIHDFKFFDDNYCADLERVRQVSHKLIQEGCDIDWNTSCRVNYVKRMSSELLELMKMSGLWNLAFGFESGSQRILDLVNKGVTVEETRTAINKLAENKVQFGGTFILGLPTETNDDILKTIQLIKYMKTVAKNSTFELYDYIPHFGTELFKMAHEYGFPEPKTLEGWSELNFRLKPWCSQSHLQMIKFVKLAATAYCEISSNINMVRKRISRGL